MFGQQVRRRFFVSYLLGQQQSGSSRGLAVVQEWIQSNILKQCSAQYHYTQSIQTAPQEEVTVLDDRKFTDNIPPGNQFGDLVGLMNVRIDQQSQEYVNSLTFFDDESLSGQSLSLDLNGTQYKHPNYERQLQLETEAMTEAVEEYQRLLEESSKRRDCTAIRSFQQVMHLWLPRLKDAISAEQEKILESSNDTNAMDIAPYIIMFKPEILAVITINRVLASIFPSSQERKKDDRKYEDQEENESQIPLSRIARLVGVAAMDHSNWYKMVIKYKEGKKIIQKLKKETKNNVLLKKQLDKEIQDFKRQQSLIQFRWPENIGQNEVQKSARIALGAEAEAWGREPTIKLGAFLIDKLINVSHLTAYGNLRSYQGLKFKLKVQSTKKKERKTMGYLVYHDELVKSITDISQVDARQLSQKYYPMVMPPIPWTSYNVGGHLTQRCCAVRLSAGCKKQLDMIKEHEPTNVYKSLSTLGQQGWRINKPILEAIKQLFEEGGGVAKIPVKENQPLPEKPDHFFRLRSRLYNLEVGNMDFTRFELRYWNHRYQKIRRKNAQQNSLRCDLRLKLAVAEQCSQEEAIYYPHNLDFRGRAYPLHPHLNHMGGDFSRGLLTFADKRPLGERGLFWLKVHLANNKGKPYDKLPLQQRSEFADEELSKILESAENPVHGSRWWTKAEKPFQFLAACMELRDALQSGDPFSFESSLPVHQDGSCNGLQHYASLGRDKKGGELVNLLPGERPSDPYTAISSQLKQRMQESAESGDELAKTLLPFIDRKMVKQTVMTSVYGVTFIGARDQISNRLAEKGLHDQEMLRACSMYATKQTMQCMMDMFTGAKEIMGWLANCAQKIGRAGETVCWYTPLGLPASQPYFEERNHTIKTVLQQITVRDGSGKGMPPKKSKQRTAFPPNYIHSIDGTHMLMTAQECMNQGLGFAAVHDSFWTHAADVDQMNKILREQFVNLHSRDLLHELLADFRLRYPNVDFDDVPRIPNDLDLNDVLKSTYFFS